MRSLHEISADVHRSRRPAESPAVVPRLMGGVEFDQVGASVP
jgi:hypothetical protein